MYCFHHHSCRIRPFSTMFRYQWSMQQIYYNTWQWWGPINLPIRPIFMPDRASALNADCAPGPGVLVLFPPVARSLMWRAVIPSSCKNQNGIKHQQKKTEALANNCSTLHLWATSCDASIAAYGEDSSRSALTFMPPRQCNSSHDNVEKTKIPNALRM
jgi:hypothetical protein